jgi:transposase
MSRSYLTEELWGRLAPLLPPEQGGRGRARFPNRPMVEAILWKRRTGAPWRELPEAYGPWTSVYTRYATWRRNGVWESVEEAMAEDGRGRR